MKAGLSNVAPCASRGVWLLLLLLVSSELMAAEARPKLNFRKRRETTGESLYGTAYQEPLYRMSIAWYNFLPKSTFSDSGQKPWTIIRRFDRN